MVAPAQTEDFQQRLAEVQAATRKLRAEAFVDYTPVVCGQRLKPITLASYTQLVAWGNAFFCGGPIALKDIVQFVWAHHPEFGQFADRARRRVTRRTAQALCPRFAVLNALIHFLTPFPRFHWLRFFRRPTALDLFSSTVEEIRRLKREATHDFPAGGDDDEPAPYAMRPQFVSIMIRGYGLGFREAGEVADTLPLKQLVEYIREALHRFSQGKASMMTPEECAVWAAYLDQKTQQAQAAKAGRS